jgi:phage gpG-like protein
MADRVEIKVDEISLEKTLANLEKIKIRAEHPREIFERARVMLGTAFADNFAQAGLPSGGWAPLDARYAAWKSVHYPGAPMLVQDGQLLSDLTTLRNTASRILDTEAEFGTAIEYAKFHQYGTSKMAKRKVIFEPPLFAEALAQQLSEYVTDGTIPG